MTREEQKASEAKKYYPDDINCYYAFLHGVEWEVKHPVSVWHDVSEEPKINEDVVLYDCCGNFIAEFFDGSVTWRNIVLYYKATMWAYADDLLPKRDKK